MKNCSNCGAEIDENAVICVKCGCAVQGKSIQTAGNEDTVSVGFVILSVLIPLFGIIYWAVKAKECPKRAKACGIAGIISMVVSILFYVIVYGVVLAAYL